MENNRLDEFERRLTVLEEMLKVKKRVIVCKVCGFDMKRPWTCEKGGCPRVVRMK